MPANPILQNVRGVPEGNVSLDVKLPLLVEIINMGDEGDAYLNAYCSSDSHTGVPPYEMGTRLKNWRPALSGQMLIYSATRGLIPATDPANLGLCGGCHPDGDCWPNPLGSTTLRFEVGYLTPDPSGVGYITTPTDSVSFTFNVVSGAAGGINWTVLLGIGAAGVALVYVLKKK